MLMLVIGFVVFYDPPNFCFSVVSHIIRRVYMKTREMLSSCAITAILSRGGHSRGHYLVVSRCHLRCLTMHSGRVSKNSKTPVSAPFWDLPAGLNFP